ncbi:glycosyl transferase [Comamonas endophytica]|uniref:Glycosyl transferase n=1 Tax=Comamonas endophytica TaxID=2949090 RepID=A0ABY6G635_9BURK|nr:glycosyl transferase [Acidovorax sp. 5MLIR]MCD2511087.1 glycosyl transferase [Acidovorax sp. D4N7]UYG50491.1 glycosyl transferase [Acidovorax sp. 5MLIR]
MNRLIYLSPVPWASFAQRPQKFVEWFHARTGSETIWVDPYPTRLPRLSDLRRIHLAATPAAQAPPRWLRVLKPLALPIEPLPGSGWINVFWHPTLMALERFARGHDTLVVAGKPSVFALAVLERLKNAHSLYDAMDEFPAFYTGISRRAMARRERKLVRQVDTLWVTSTRLQQCWSPLRPDLRCVANALDDRLMPAPRVRDHGLQAKVFGYAGTIASWFDWNWVIALARARPLDVVRLIGPVFHAAPAALPGNIELLPGRSHPAALGAMREFDVGLIPFLSNDLTASVDPIKFYEYRALNLPVISTRFGEMALRAQEPGTFISLSEQDTAALADAALALANDCAAAREFAARNTWKRRFDAAQLLP